MIYVCRKESQMKKRLIKLATLLGIVFIFFVSNAPSMFSAEESEQYTFYNTASDVAQVMEEYTAKGKNTFAKVAKKITNGEVGNFLGVRDKDRSKGSIAFTSVEITKANSSISYDQLGVTKTSETPAFGNTGLDFSGYVIYGEAMKSAGLDAIDGDLIAKPFRMLQGVLMWAGLTAIRAIDNMWSAVGQMLNFINPFRLFTQALQSVNQLQDFTGLGEESWMGAIGKTIAEFYTALTNLAVNVTVPVIILLAILWLFFSTNMFKSVAWLRKGIALLAFVGLVFPLLGSVYTSAIGYMSGINTSSKNVDQQVNSILFDFEKNVTENGMSTNGISLVYDREAQGLTGNTVKNLRKMVLASNNASSDAEAGRIAGRKQDGTIDASQGSRGLDRQLDQYETDKANAKTDLVMDRIIKFMSNKAYLASEYESMVKTGETVDSLFGKKLQNKNEVKKFIESGFEGEQKPKLLTATNANGVQVEHAGKLTTVTVEKGGFSPLATYNYLSSEFNGRSLTMTSATNTSSLIARSNHYAVNIAGGGVLSFLYWLETVFLMFTVSVVGIMYISGMVKDSVSSAFTIIGNMFKVSVGAVNGIARIMGAFVLLLLSVFGTVFFYQIFKEILFAVPVALSAMLAVAPNADNAIVVSSYEGLASALTCFICFFLGQVALKNRKEFIHGFNETIEAIVHQIIGTNGNGGMKWNEKTPSLKDTALQTKAGALGLAGLGANAVLGKKDEEGNRQGGGLRIATDMGNNLLEKAKNSSAGQYVADVATNAGGELKDLGQKTKEAFHGTALGGAIYSLQQKRKVKQINKNAGQGEDKPKSSFKKVVDQLREAPLTTIKDGISGAVDTAKDVTYAGLNYNQHRQDLAERNAERDGNNETLFDTSRTSSFNELMQESAKRREEKRLEKLSSDTEKRNAIEHRDRGIEYDALWSNKDKQERKELRKTRKESKKAGERYAKTQQKAKKQIKRRVK